MRVKARWEALDEESTQSAYAKACGKMYHAHVFGRYKKAVVSEKYLSALQEGILMDSVSDVYKRQVLTVWEWLHFFAPGSDSVDGLSPVWQDGSQFQRWKRRTRKRWSVSVSYTHLRY